MLLSLQRISQPSQKPYCTYPQKYGQRRLCHLHRLLQCFNNNINPDINTHNRKINIISLTTFTQDNTWCLCAGFQIILEFRAMNERLQRPKLLRQETQSYNRILIIKIVSLLSINYSPQNGSQISLCWDILTFINKKFCYAVSLLVSAPKTSGNRSLSSKD